MQNRAKSTKPSRPTDPFDAPAGSAGNPRAHPSSPAPGGSATSRALEPE